MSPLSGHILQVKQDVALSLSRKSSERKAGKEMARDELRLESLSGPGVYLVQAPLRPGPASVTLVLTALHSHLLNITKDGESTASLSNYLLGPSTL